MVPDGGVEVKNTSGQCQRPGAVALQQCTRQPCQFSACGLQDRQRSGVFSRRCRDSECQRAEFTA